MDVEKSDYRQTGSKHEIPQYPPHPMYYPPPPQYNPYYPQYHHYPPPPGMQPPPIFHNMQPYGQYPPYPPQYQHPDIKGSTQRQNQPGKPGTGVFGNFVMDQLSQGMNNGSGNWNQR